MKKKGSVFSSEFGRLRRNMFVSIVGILAFVLALIFSLMNFYFFRKEYTQSVELLSELLANGGHRAAMVTDDDSAERPAQDFERLRAAPLNIVPPSFDSESDGRSRTLGDRNFGAGRRNLRQIFFPKTFDVLDYFTIRTDPAGNITEVISDRPVRCEKSLYLALVGESFSHYRLTEDVTGFKCGIRWKIAADEDGFLVACVDRRSAWRMYCAVLSGCGACFFMFVGAAAVFAWVFSGLTLKPMRRMFAKQKQFIADAGHELKTPIAVIGANVDVLLGEQPGNKWLHYIQEENDRLSILVKELLYLAQNDADRMKLVIRRFNFSDMVETVILPFESMIYEQDKTLALKLEDGIFMNGDENQLKEVVVVLIDNAVKNTEPGADIRVSTSRHGNFCVLKVFNTGRGIPHGELDKIFERFYRSDFSRARNDTGGYGLGLAIAKTTVLQHYGTIKAESEEGEWVEFTVKLPISAFVEKAAPS